jgi:hypothetical protein
MEDYKMKREIVAACIESPFYLTLPLKSRLQLVNHFEDQVVSNLRGVFLSWVKTGVFRQE